MELDFLLEDEKSELLSAVEKKLFKERIIYLNENISAYTIDAIVPLIDLINEMDKDTPVEQRTPLKLYINSHGGSAYDGWYLVSAIENSKTPIHTYVLGYAMSMGLPIFLAGKKRFLGKYAVLLYHELRGGAEGTRQEVKRMDKEYDRLQKVYDDYIISKTTVTQDILNDHQDRVSDWYIDATQAEKHSMFDTLI